MRRNLIVIILVAIFLGLITIPLIRSSDDFPANSQTGSTEISIEEGEYGSSIANKLAGLGVIKSSAKFTSLLLADSHSRGISPGRHRIDRHIPSSLALTQLLDQKRIMGVVVVKEGSTYLDVLAALQASPQISGKTLGATGVGGVNPTLPNKLNSLEGQLAPAQYSFADKTPLKSALAAISKNFAREFSSWGSKVSGNGYSAYQILIIASMVQMEGDPTSYAKVARTIFNRLKIGMPLQLNSTVQYILHERGKITLSTQATHISSPYNTYLHQGLPPTPISNPSSPAIEAVLSPASGKWLYFITVKPGDTRFTDKYSEFQSWEIQYNINVRKGLFR